MFGKISYIWRSLKWLWRHRKEKSCRQSKGMEFSQLEKTLLGTAQLVRDMTTFVNMPIEQAMKKVHDAIKNEWYGIKYLNDPRGCMRMPFYYMQRLTLWWILFKRRSK
jgi:hypothetical protein